MRRPYLPSSARVTDDPGSILTHPIGLLTGCCQLGRTERPRESGGCRPGLSIEHDSGRAISDCPMGGEPKLPFSD